MTALHVRYCLLLFTIKFNKIIRKKGVVLIIFFVTPTKFK